MNRRRALLLLGLPAATYLISYGYLAAYHGRLWLGAVIVHESGELTWLQTVLYASHFLGHIPSLTIIAILLVGALRVWSAADPLTFKWQRLTQLLGFLAGCVLVSVFCFGSADTISYLTQLRQGVHRVEPGGSWLLHLPSTLLLFPFLILYAFATIWFVTGAVPRATQRGAVWYLVAAAGLIVISLSVLTEPISALGTILLDPRYHAHSVRELATFPLTFFPLPFYFILRHESARATSPPTRTAILLLSLCLLMFVAGFAYQIQGSLAAGVGNIAQRPAFAHSEGLSIPYLLAAHYFEHVLDTVYFTLLCLLLHSLPRGLRRSRY